MGTPEQKYGAMLNGVFEYYLNILVALKSYFFKLFGETGSIYSCDPASPSINHFKFAVYCGEIASESHVVG